jgi:hypothetical protein
MGKAVCYPRMVYEPLPKSLPEFVPWPKIPRWNRDVTVSEKIDGTNAAIWVSDDGTEIAAQSRTKWITPQDDNAGFARWVEQNREELLHLGPGHHHGEWFGQGIQRKYGLTEKRFWLFNTHRWGDPSTRPACVGCVPVIWKGNASELDIPGLINKLKTEGSLAVPGWMQPEGIVVFHHASDQYYKVLCEGDDLPKGVTTYKERQVAERLTK